jgi:hypothetical protein
MQNDYRCKKTKFTSFCKFCIWLIDILSVVKCQVINIQLFSCWEQLYKKNNLLGKLPVQCIM